MMQSHPMPATSSIHIPAHESPDLKPEFIRLPRSGKQCPRTGLSRSKFNELILASKLNNFRPPVKSIVIRTPGRSRGVRLIDYASLLEFLYIALNTDEWDSYTKDHQHRICEAIATISFLDEMHLNLAYLTLDNGRTKVGSISHVAFGRGCEFTPNDDYWKYR
jgi:hypothetical protein